MAALCEPIALLRKRLKDKKLVEKEDFPEDPKSKIGSPTEHGFRVGACNVQSIINQTRLDDKVKPFVKVNSFKIFAIIETQLLNRHHTGPELNLPGYSYVRKDRRYAKKQRSGMSKLDTTGMPAELNSNAGGGILIYIHNTVRYKVKSRGEYAESNVEFLHIEITYPVQLHLVALYCPAKTHVDHLISLMSYFMDPLGERKIMFIGDTNINRYNKKPTAQHKLGNTFFDVLRPPPYKVKQLIDRKTHEKACIDHIFTNQKVIEHGVIENPLTLQTEKENTATPKKKKSKKGHKCIYCTIKTDSPPKCEDHESDGKAMTKCTYDHVLQVIPFVKKLGDKLTGDKCILAVFLKLETKVGNFQIKKPEKEKTVDVENFYWEDEVAFYITIDCEENQRMARLNTTLKLNESIVKEAKKKQCTIFTRNHQSPTFHALQKKMWYKSWDYVWQPRHVEFLGHVLEPSLTHMLPMGGMWDPSVDELTSIKRQESTYRYVADVI